MKKKKKKEIHGGREFKTRSKRPSRGGRLRIEEKNPLPLPLLSLSSGLRIGFAFGGRVHVWLLIASDERLCSTRRERNKDGYIYTVRIYARTYTYMHIYIHIRIYIYIHTHVRIYAHTRGRISGVRWQRVLCTVEREYKRLKAKRKQTGSSSSKPNRRGSKTVRGALSAVAGCESAETFFPLFPIIFPHYFFKRPVK